MKRLLFLILISTYAVPEQPREEDLLFQQGLHYYQQQRFKEALLAFSKVLEIDPMYPNAYRLFLDTLKKRAEKVKIEDTEPLKKEVVPLKEEKMPKEKREPVREEFKEEIVIPKIEEDEKPEVPKMFVDYLFCRDLIKRGLYESALNELDKILKDIPQTKIGDKILFTIAYIRFKQEDYDEVLSTLNRLLSSYPKTVLKYEVNLMAADTLFFQKKFADARVAYLKVGYQLAEEREVLEDEYSNIPPTPRAKKELLAEAQLGVANCYKRLSEYQSAIVEYQKVLDLYPDTASADDACFFLADIYDRIHSVRDLERAVEIYRMLIERYPESIWADRAKERKRYLEENYL